MLRLRLRALRESRADDHWLPTWLIPMVYLAVSTVTAVALARLEHEYLQSYLNDISVGAALAFVSAIAAGMMSLTAIVFSIAYITVQFNAVAYSPRLALWFARDRRMFHTLGIFIATFMHALTVMVWVDRGGSGGVPLLSGLVLAALMSLSMFSFSWLIRGLSDLQVTSTLRHVGDAGRNVIRETFERLDERTAAERETGTEALERDRLAPVTQALTYAGEPLSISRFEIATLVRLAREADAVIEMQCAVGDTLVDGTQLLDVHGGTRPIPENQLRRCVRLSTERTFEQDPKYPIRLLVDVSIKALSPAINDPTTAVQAIDQLEDLLRRLSRRELDAGFARDKEGRLRLIFPMPSWEDYLRLSFDEIRQFGNTSIQVVRRLRAALIGIADAAVGAERTAQVQRYLAQLDQAIARSSFDAEDRVIASQEDRQGLGLSRHRTAGVSRLVAPTDAGDPAVPLMRVQG